MTGGQRLVQTTAVEDVVPTELLARLLGERVHPGQRIGEPRIAGLRANRAELDTREISRPPNLLAKTRDDREFGGPVVLGRGPPPSVTSRRYRVPAVDRKVRSRRLLETTNTELNAMAAPAIIGLRSPAAATGRAATL